MLGSQYSSGRPTSKSLPRNFINGGASKLGPYSRLDLIAKNEPPVNAKQFDEEPEEIDYSFSNLSVRERKNLLLNKVASQQIQKPQVMTLPRNRSRATSQIRMETQSDIGGSGIGGLGGGGGGFDENFAWGEPSLTPSPWAGRSHHGSPPRPSHLFSSGTSATSRTLDMAATRFNQLQQQQQQQQQQLQQHHQQQYQPRGKTIWPVSHQQTQSLYRHPSQYATGPFASSSRETSSIALATTGHVSRMMYRPQFSTTMRIGEPSSAYSSTTRSLPIKRYSSSTGPIVYGTSEGIQDGVWSGGDMGPWSGGNIYTSSRTVQPLRINVYNSDGIGNLGGPVYSRGPLSPVYPAYPAYSGKTNYDAPTQVYTTGGHSGRQHFQPVTLYTSTSGPSHHTGYPANRPTAIYTHSTRGSTPRPQQPQFGSSLGQVHGTYGYSAPVSRRRTTPGLQTLTPLRQYPNTAAMVTASDEAGVSEF